ncbi:MAG: HEAT repeat domain-containing protein [Gemmataceae bacterium]
MRLISGKCVGAVAVALGIGALVTIQTRAQQTEATVPEIRPATELAAALYDPDPDVRRAAANDLIRHGPAATPALTPLLNALRDPDVLLRAHASAALGKMGPIAVPALAQALSDPETWVRRGAAAALLHHRSATDESIAALIAALDDVDIAVREQSAQALAVYGAPAIAALKTALVQGSPMARQLAATALGETSDLSRLPPLVAALADPDVEVRRSVALALSYAGRLAINDLVEALRGPNPDARLAAADALYRMGPAAESAQEALAEALAEDSPSLRIRVAGALALIGPKATAAVKPLHALLKDDDETVRLAAAEALGRIGREARPAVPTLLELQADAAAAVRRAATRALQLIVFDGNRRG